jgi:signal transduction histidine kinase
MEQEDASLLFQVVRELLMNVAKHAKANRATVALSTDTEQFQITVADDGKGFEPIEIQQRKERGFGLFNIRERLSLCGGVIAIDSGIGKGTRIEIRFPLNQRNDPA